MTERSETTTPEGPAEAVSPATDADIEQIIAENEPGIGDLLAAYEHIEQQYFSVASPRVAVRATTNTAT
jgi:hypothetical protein